MPSSTVFGAVEVEAGVAVVEVPPLAVVVVEPLGVEVVVEVEVVVDVVVVVVCSRTV